MVFNDTCLRKGSPDDILNRMRRHDTHLAFILARSETRQSRSNACPWTRGELQGSTGKGNIPMDIQGDEQRIRFSIPAAVAETQAKRLWNAEASRYPKCSIHCLTTFRFSSPDAMENVDNKPHPHDIHAIGAGAFERSPSPSIEAGRP